MAAGYPCNDSKLCTFGDKCNGSGSCAGSAVSCDDGFFCNGTEECLEGTGCVPKGDAPNLNDNVDCTVDKCDDVADKVVHTPIHAKCSNGVFCDGAEQCDVNAGKCVAATSALPSDDGIDCTVDSCNEELDFIENKPNDAEDQVNGDHDLAVCPAVGVKLVHHHCLKMVSSVQRTPVTKRLARSFIRRITPSVTTAMCAPLVCVTQRWAAHL